MPSDYWIQRAALRMQHYQRATAADRKRIARLYEAASAEMRKEVDTLLRRYISRYDLTRDEARQLLASPVTQAEYNQLERQLQRMTGTPDELRLAKARVNAESFRFRISRLERMRKSARAVCMEISGISNQIIADSLFSTAEDATYRVLFDMQQQAGFAWDSAGISRRRIEFLLRENWSGQHFSDRIWNNADKMAQRLSDLLIQGALGGKSYKQITDDIALTFDSGYKNAERLIRTETSHIANACELEQYKEEEVRRYIYVATLDMRTSEICQNLDTRVFNVADAVEGKNFPPMHPWCRSTTIADIDTEFYLNHMQRRAMDENGMPVYVPANMDYKSWKAWHDSGYAASAWTDKNGTVHDLERPSAPAVSSPAAAPAPRGSALARNVARATVPHRPISERITETVDANGVRHVTIKTPPRDET